MKDKYWHKDGAPLYTSIHIWTKLFSSTIGKHYATHIFCLWDARKING
jgi:hypothetical protein